MGGLTYEKCEVIPVELIRKHFGEKAANYSEEAVKACTAATSDIDKYGPKDCGDGNQTPPLHWGGVNLELINLPAQFSFKLSFWVGVQEVSNGKCLWIGADLGVHGAVCKKIGCYSNDEVSYEDLAPAFKQLLDSIGDKVEDGSAIDIAVAFFVTILALVLVAAAAELLIDGGILAVVGSLGASVLGGAAMILG